MHWSCCGVSHTLCLVVCDGAWLVGLRWVNHASFSLLFLPRYRWVSVSLKVGVVGCRGWVGLVRGRARGRLAPRVGVLWDAESGAPLRGALAGSQPESAASRAYRTLSCCAHLPLGSRGVSPRLTSAGRRHKSNHHGDKIRAFSMPVSEGRRGFWLSCVSSTPSRRLWIRFCFPPHFDRTRQTR